ncbi:MAG TPA: NAD(P)/FAD-dependent oxidoreductase [Bryobacteraceae bacterium]|nr:NAD(P)/FAD-dependent oxidoreductase [Bryobacteraceae bacterium]HOQ46926.1 NAD(P)/FAD-dependent oxidoreductase [Bryobacteraceae bacterium]HPU73051.1 NAD(P)/FAD-dependent oxidoreductase [Bryobacteraceae bacterium]
MKRVAVLGGGPAGAFAAERLASAGLDTIVLDEKLAWEKPCGGGLTFKAYDRYPFLFHNDTPKRFVTDTLLVAPRAGAARLSLRKPLVIYSRLDLNRMLLERASRAGARIEKTRVLEVTRNGNWAIRTTGGTIEADFCIVATGARNSLKNMGTRLTPADTMRALGYYVPGDQKHIDIQFLPQLEGYIWVFPRCGHLSVGICGKGVPAQDLRLRLERFMEERRISTKDGRFYSHLLPSLGSSGWRNNRVAGQGWLAVGDAAGLVDPITGEGIYYAMRSGDLASQVVLSDAHPPAEKHRAYRALLVRDFAADLAYGAAIARRFFLGKFLFRSVPERMVAFLRRSPRFYDLMQDLFAGTQPYSSLKNRLLRNLHGTFLDIFLNLLFHRPEVAEENQV